MDKKLLNQYKLIGEIQSVTAKSSTIDEALRRGLQTIINGCGADHAVFYYKDKDGILHPYYWVCPKDFTLTKYKSGEGVVGRTYLNQKSTRLLDYKRNKQADVDRDFEGFNISSLVCVPISTKSESVGVIEFIKEEGQFTEEEADICEMLSSLAAIQVDDKETYDQSWNMGKPILSVKDVKKEYINGEFTTKVLKGVNVDVYEGEFLILLGESGCGKSTLLNIIGGMDKVTEGKVTYLDKDITNASQKELTDYRRDNIGFIFQSYNLMPNLNVKQNLDLIAELVDNPMDTDEALKLVGLYERRMNYPSQLSGGQQQRVSIARALIKNPKIIMADEPTAALDYETSIEVLSVLEKIIKKGTTLVMVTHNEEITRMCDRVIRMRNGRTYEITVNRRPVHAEELVW